MDHEPVLTDMLRLKSLARQINEHLAHLTVDEVDALLAAFPDLEALYKNISRLARPGSDMQSLAAFQAEPADDPWLRAFLQAYSLVDPGGHSVVSGEDLIFRYINPSYRALTPHPELDPSGQPYEKVWPPEEGFTQNKIIRQAIHDQQEVHLQRHQRRMPGGKVCYYTYHILPMILQGEPAACLFLWDTTDLVMTEVALRESEGRLAGEREWFRITLSSIGDAVITTDARGRVSFLNPIAERLTGWSLEAAAGLPMEQIFKIINEQTRQPAVNPVTRVLQEGIIVGLANHTALIDRQGRETPIEDSAAPIKDANGQILGVVMVFRDVTEKRKTEQALLQSRVLLQAVLDGLPDAIFLKDMDSRILLANPATLAVVGKPAELVIGRCDTEIYDDPAVGQAIIANDRQVMASGQTQVIEERVLQPGDPPEYERIFRSTKTPLRDADGQVIGVIGIAHEVTAQKQREHELQRLNRTLKALNKSQQAMLRASNERAFMQEVCHVIIEDCGYAMAWIGLAENDMAQTVRPVAHAGNEDGFLDQLRVTWADDEYGNGPTGTTIRTGQPVLLRDLASDLKVTPWRDAALERGYVAALGLPLTGFGRTFGAVTIFASEGNAFSDDEVRLLAELAGDLGYGIATMRIRDAHTKAELALRESEERYRSLFESMTEGFALHEIRCDDYGAPVDYRFLEVNPAFERLTGLSQAGVRGKWKSEVEQLRGDDPSWVEIYGRVALTGEPVHFRNYSPALNRHYDVFAYRPALMQFAVIFIDITDRVQTEDALRQARETAEHSRTQVEVQHRLIEQREQERQRIAHDLHDGPVQAITGITYTIQSLAAESPDSEQARLLDEVRSDLQEVIGELRSFAQELRPPVLFQFGLRRAVEAHLESFQESHPDLLAQLSIEWASGLLPEPVAIALFRVYQESLNNIVKHARATEVQITLACAQEHVHLTLEDNGMGFNLPRDPLQLTRKGHLGLAGMRERIEAVGGSLEVDSSPGNGTRIRVQVPLEQASQQP